MPRRGEIPTPEEVMPGVSSDSDTLSDDQRIGIGEKGEALENIASVDQDAWFESHHPEDEEQRLAYEAAEKKHKITKKHGIEPRTETADSEPSEAGPYTQEQADTIIGELDAQRRKLESQIRKKLQDPDLTPEDMKTMLMEVGFKTEEEIDTMPPEHRLTILRAMYEAPTKPLDITTDSDEEAWFSERPSPEAAERYRREEYLEPGEFAELNRAPRITNEDIERLKLDAW